MSQGVTLAIVGATGAVGREMLNILEEREFNIKKLFCLADPREAGTRLAFRNEIITVQAPSPEIFKAADIALLAVGTDISKILAPQAVKNKCVAIDNSYAFRLDKDVPLVVPEVNAKDIWEHKGIIANPNCSTIIMTVAINPIHKVAGLKRVIVSTYQAVSGAGIGGIEELERNIQSNLEGQPFLPEVFQHQIAFNVIPHIDEFVSEGYTREEMKMVWESRKIMHTPELKITATAVRVPVYRSHSESINLETERNLSPSEARDILSAAPGITVLDDPEKNLYPMPLDAAHKDDVFIGRIRKDLALDNGLAMWVVSDQIRKGAATNAIQIAEIVAAENLY